MATKEKRLSRYKIELTVEAANITSVESKLRQHFGNAAAAHATKIELNKSRADRLDDAAGLVQDAKCEVEELCDEIQGWYDNLPESFQNGDKGSALQECIDGLDNISSELDSVDFGNVNFPGMYD